MDKVELQRASAALRRHASLALQADFNQVKARIKRLVTFVENTEVLREEVVCAPTPERDPLEVLELATENFTSLPAHTHELEEIGFLHALLRSLASDDEPFRRRVGFYNGVSGIGEARDALLHDMIYPYVSYLEGCLGSRLVAAVKEESGSVQVVFGDSANANVSVATGAAEIRAEQNVGVVGVEVVRAAQELQALVREVGGSVPRELRQELNGLAGEVLFEVEEDEPAPSRLTRIKDRLQELADDAQDSVELVSGAVKLAGAVGQLLDKITA